MTDQFAERYAIQRELGRGAFGVVYLAHDLRLRSRPVALKILHPVLSTDPGVVRLFQNEAGVLATLQHDNIVAVHDADVWQDRRYIVMAFVDGPSLAQIVQEQGAQPAEQVATWLRQAASALAFAHEQGVLHRDVKSANLLWDRPRSRVVVTDFGLARAVEASGGTSYQSTVGVLTGTAAYRAPEVVKTGHTVASDLYSLGVVAYELLSGRLPFVSDDPLSLMMLHANEPPPPLPAGTPAGLAKLVTGLLAKQPDDRPRSAAAVVDALAATEPVAAATQPAVQASEPDSAASPPPPMAQPAAGEVTPAWAQIPHEAQPRGRATADGKPGSRGLLVAGALAVIAVVAIGVFALRGGEDPGGSPTAVPPTPSRLVALVPAATTPTPTPTILPTTATPTPTATIVPDTPTPTATPTLSPTSTPTPTLGIGSRLISDKDGMEMVYVPAGEFTMGSPDGVGEDDEHPQHTVYLGAFYIDKTKVTNAQFARFVEATGHQTDAEKAGSGLVFDPAAESWSETQGADWRHPRGPASSLEGLAEHPVVLVSWNDAVAYCAWAGRRLPSEAEWEKVARGTDARTYPWGEQAPGGDLLNFADRNLDAGWADKQVDDGYQFTAPVGSYPAGASPYGALDMAGNVWEWVADWYSDTYYASSPRENPQGPASGEYRVLRGGSWYDLTGFVRAANRFWFSPGHRFDGFGFRCARSP